MLKKSTCFNFSQSFQSRFHVFHPSYVCIGIYIREKQTNSLIVIIILDFDEQEGVWIRNWLSYHSHDYRKMEAYKPHCQPQFLILLMQLLKQVNLHNYLQLIQYGKHLYESEPVLQHTIQWSELYYQLFKVIQKKKTKIWLK